MSHTAHASASVKQSESWKHGETPPALSAHKLGENDRRGQSQITRRSHI